MRLLLANEVSYPRISSTLLSMAISKIHTGHYRCIISIPDPDLTNKINEYRLVRFRARLKRRSLTT